MRRAGRGDAGKLLWASCARLLAFSGVFLAKKEFLSAEMHKCGLCNGLVFSGTAKTGVVQNRVTLSETQEMVGNSASHAAHVTCAWICRRQYREKCNPECLESEPRLKTPSRGTVEKEFLW